MKESPILVELSPGEAKQLETLIGPLGQIRFPRMHRLINYEGQDFLFLDGPDCSHLPEEIAKIDYERGKPKDLLAKKLDKLRQEAWPSPYKVRFVVARRAEKQRSLSLSVLEMLPNGPRSGLNEDAQSDLATALRFFSSESRFLQEMEPAVGYPEPDVVLDGAKTTEMVGEINQLLSKSHSNRGMVTPLLEEQLRDILPVLHHALKEALYVWLSKA